MEIFELESVSPVLCKVRDKKTGEIYEDEFFVRANASGYHWTEDMHPDGIGYYQTFWDYDIDESSFHIDKETELLEILDKDNLEFEVEDYWEEEPEPDYDDYLEIA